MPALASGERAEQGLCASLCAQSLAFWPISVNDCLQTAVLPVRFPPSGMAVRAPRYLYFQLILEPLITMKMRQSLADWETAFENEMALDRQRRVQLRRRAVARSRARHIERSEKSGRVRFSVLFVALSATVVTVTLVMFETLALLMS